MELVALYLVGSVVGIASFAAGLYNFTHMRRDGYFLREAWALILFHFWPFLAGVAAYALWILAWMFGFISV